MKEKVKKWIEREYKQVKNWGADKYSIQCATHRSFGVLMFAINELFDDYNEELSKWWEDEMLPKFRELENNPTRERDLCHIDWKER